MNPFDCSHSSTVWAQQGQCLLSHRGRKCDLKGQVAGGEGRGGGGGGGVVLSNRADPGLLASSLGLLYY